MDPISLPRLVRSAHESAAPLASRRGFLVAAGGLVVAAACGGGKDKGGARTSTTVSQANAPIQGAVASSDLYVQAGPQRFAFGILRKVENNQYETVDRKPARISFVGPKGRRIEARAATFHDTGLEHEERHGIYTVDAVFDVAGIWRATIEVEGDQGPLPFEVGKVPQVPAPGQAAISTPSPTPQNPLGVNPICTRDPVCPLHSVSLDQALKQGKPIALMFATPARCVSRWCGPVLDVLLTHMPEYQDRVTFIHVEIYKDLQSNQLVPTVEKWGLATEPWLYGIDASGTIVGRFDGGFDGGEMKALLDRLVA